jgi:hypothetical protein
MSQANKAKLFAKLHVTGSPVILYNAWDAGSAKTIVEAGAQPLQRQLVRCGCSELQRRRRPPDIVRRTNCGADRRFGSCSGYHRLRRRVQRGRGRVGGPLLKSGERRVAMLMLRRRRSAECQDRRCRKDHPHPQSPLFQSPIVSVSRRRDNCGGHRGAGSPAEPGCARVGKESRQGSNAVLRRSGALTARQTAA